MSTPALSASTPAARRSFLPYHRPSIDEADIAAVVAVLRSGWLTTGAEAHAFESEFAAAVGARHGVAVNSCTAALHLALEAVGVGPGDEVIVPTMTFAASAEVVFYRQARPVLVDSLPACLNMDPDRVAAAITPRTKAIIAVHYGGQPCDLDRLQALARQHRIALIEDAAHAFPAEFAGRPIGAQGNLTCFSFYATKNITTGEGGFAATDDPDLYRRMKIMSLHGISHDAWNRYAAEGSWYYEVIEPGFKYNLTDVAAALGRQQLRRASAFHARRRQLAAAYTLAFADVPELLLPRELPGRVHSWHLYPLRLDLERLRIGRNQFIEELKERGIGTSVHFIPLHFHPFYSRELRCRPGAYPVASAAFERLISLPLYPAMSDENCESVVAAVEDIVRLHRK